MIKCHCTHCGNTFQMADEYAGTRITCGKCGYRVEVPDFGSGAARADTADTEIGTDWTESGAGAQEPFSVEEVSAEEETVRAEPVFAPGTGYSPGAPPGAVPDPKEGLAKASLGLGLLGFFCCCALAGIPAVICGHLALGHFGGGPPTRSRGYAIAGLILGYVSIVLMVLNLLLGIVGNFQYVD